MLCHYAAATYLWVMEKHMICRENFSYSTWSRIERKHQGQYMNGSCATLICNSSHNMTVWRKKHIILCQKNFIVFSEHSCHFSLFTHHRINVSMLIQPKTCQFLHRGAVKSWKFENFIRLERWHNHAKHIAQQNLLALAANSHRWGAADRLLITSNKNTSFL
jgi:hypothetical protein